MAQADCLLRLDAVRIGYHGRPLMSPISMCVERGDFIGLAGPNGAGKTTLLRTMLGLHPPVGGKLERPMDGSLQFGYVPQRENLDRIFPLTSLEVAMMGRFGRIGLGRRVGSADRQLVGQALERLGVADAAQKRFSDLSGGQQQRVLIARALAGEPSLLVLDEPTNGMDIPSEGAIMRLLAELHAAGTTVLLVSHVLHNVINYVAKLAYINKDRDLFYVGTRDEVLTEESLTHLYGSPVRIGRIEGGGDYRVVLPPADGEVRDG